MKRTNVLFLLTSFVCGVIFAVGLGVAGMTQPAKVLAFLDVAGAWDPSLALVMGGAIAVHLGFAQMAKRRAAKGEAPALADAYALPKKTAIDAPLLIGTALFGVGWGIAGFCPGPAVVSLVTLAPGTLAFVAAMLVGMAMYELASRATGRAKPRGSRGWIAAHEPGEKP